MKVDVSFSEESLEISGTLLSSRLIMNLTFQEEGKSTPTNLTCKIDGYARGEFEEGNDRHEVEIKYLKRFLERVKDKNYIRQIIKEEISKYLNHKDRELERLKKELSEAFIQIEEEGFEFSISD